MDPEYHLRLRNSAKRLNLSLNSFILKCLERATQDTEYPFEQIISLLKKFLKESFTGLLLFGSTARGEARESSDTDLLVVVSQNMKINSQLYRSWNKFLEKENAESVSDEFSLHFSHLPERQKMPSGLWLECALDAKIIKDTLDSQSHSRLKELRTDILDGKYQRKRVHGQAYWVENL